MKSTHDRRIVRMGVLSIVILMLGMLTACPSTTTARTVRLDVEQIDTYVRAEVQRHGIPGLALAMVEGDQIVHLAGYGTADETGRPVTSQTPFVLASVSKPITALAIMQLVEAGKLELDAPVQRYLHEFRVADSIASQQITVRHLLQHTSGIPEQGCQNSRFGAETLEEFVSKLHTIELDAPVGARYFYCSGNYNVLGRVIEVVSGQSYASYIEQQVFAPLNMRHSFTSEHEAERAGLAQGYRWLFGMPIPFDYAYDRPQMPSGFLVSSAEDMANFLIAQLNGGQFGTSRILSPGGIATMQANGVPAGVNNSTYGLGWKKKPMGGVAAILHTGDHPNTHTLVFMEPHTRRGVVLLMNTNGLLPSLSAFTEIEHGVARMIMGEEPSMAGLSLPRLYLIVNAVLVSLLALASWPLVRLRRWEHRLRQQHQGQSHRLRVGLRVAGDVTIGLTLLISARQLLGALGAQSWSEGFLLLPDFVAWLWGVSLIVLLTGALRLVLTLHLIRHSKPGRTSANLVASPSKRPA